MANSSPSTIHPRWQEYLNSVWACQRSDILATRNGVQILYGRLLANKELVPVETAHSASPSPCHANLLIGSVAASPSQCDTTDHISVLLEDQLRLARLACSESTFCIILRQRLAVLQRILYAFWTKYHTKDKMKAQLGVRTEGGDGGQPEPSNEAPSTERPERTLSGSQALLELGVLSGLSLLFALLKQSWSYRQTSGAEGEVNLCSDVLRTALRVIQGLPPLSLANESQVSVLGCETLQLVTRFLQTTAAPHSGADIQGQKLACELLLALAVQRGSLRLFLDWIEMALACSARGGCAIDATHLKTIVGAVTPASVRAVGVWDRLDNVEASNAEDTISLYQAAMALMQQLVSLACDYTHSWLGAADSTRGGMVTGSDGGTVAGSGACLLPPQPEKCDVYVWGSNSSHQLAEGLQEKILEPKLAKSFTNVQQVEAGQYCTFMISTGGEVSACGKGSYGRLGLGDSNNQVRPKRIPIDAGVRFKKLSSSKGSDGHSLALSEDGQVYSWGDGDYGKLGHGDSTMQKQPKLVGGVLAGKRVTWIHAGYRHSAAVTDEGELYTWGEGEHGRLGHGDCNARNVPTLVQNLSGVGSVACGSAHTIVLSADGKTVWSFGSAEGGKLGQGSTARVYWPRVIDSLQGLYIKKVGAGSQFSMALTSNGQASLQNGISACATRPRNKFGGTMYIKKAPSMGTPSVYSHFTTHSSSNVKSSRSMRSIRMPWYQRPLLQDAYFLDIQRGSMLCAIYSLVLSIFTVMTGVFDLYSLAMAAPGSTHYGFYFISYQFVYVGNRNVRNVLILFALFSLIAGCVVFVTSIMLILALRKELERKVLPWLYCFAVFTILRFLALLFFLIVNDLIFGYNISMLLLWAIFTAANVYAWIIILCI